MASASSSARVGLILLVSLDHDGLQILGACHCARAATAGGPFVLVHDVGEAYQLLAGRTDAHHCAISAVFSLEGLDGVARFHAPDGRSIVQGDGAVLDVGIGRALSLALEQQTVEAGPLELGSRPAAHVAVGHGAGQRRLGNDRQPAAHLDLGARQRTSHHAQEVVGRKGLDLRPVVKHVLDAQAAGADVFAHILVVERLVGDSARAQIDASNPIVESCDHVTNLLKLIRLWAGLALRQVDCDSKQKPLCQNDIAVEVSNGVSPEHEALRKIGHILSSAIGIPFACTGCAGLICQKERWININEYTLRTAATQNRHEGDTEVRLTTQFFSAIIHMR